MVFLSFFFLLLFGRRSETGEQAAGGGAGLRRDGGGGVPVRLPRRRPDGRPARPGRALPARRRRRPDRRRRRGLLHGARPRRPGALPRRQEPDAAQEAGMRIARILETRPHLGSIPFQAQQNPWNPLFCDPFLPSPSEPHTNSLHSLESRASRMMRRFVILVQCCRIIPPMKSSFVSTGSFQSQRAPIVKPHTC